MDQFEKVDKLATRAGVSFESAKQALEANNWDMLDAMIMLEKQSGAEGTGRPDYSTTYDAQPGYTPIGGRPLTRRERKERKFAEREELKEQKRREHDEKRARCRENTRSFFSKLNAAHLVLKHNDSKFVDIPLWLVLIIMIVFWKFSLVFIIISLLLGCKYSVSGPGNYEAGNNILGAVGKAADTVVKKANEIGDQIAGRIAGKRSEKAEDAEHAADAAENAESAETADAAENAESTDSADAAEGKNED